jgi:hypothetical protein
VGGSLAEDNSSADDSWGYWDLVDSPEDNDSGAGSNSSEGDWVEDSSAGHRLGCRPLVQDQWREKESVK